MCDNGDPDQMRHSAESDLGLHCLPVTHLGVFSGLKKSVTNKIKLKLQCTVSIQKFQTLYSIFFFFCLDFDFNAVVS